jgi:hypothetical protein
VSQIKEVHGRDTLGQAAAGRSRMTLFGITPSALRRLATAAQIAEIRKISTARRLLAV